MRYRLVTKPAYCGCMPTTAYVVQVSRQTLTGEKWVDVKPFADYNDAKRLLEMLEE